MKTGAWTTYDSNLTEERMNLFNKATKDLMGVNYQPIAVATQVVSGTNYSYFCNATITNQSQDTYTAMVDLHQQPDGTVHLTEIRRIQP